jgi:hypothetical protein
MEGRIITPLTPGVQKRARQGKAEGISRPNKGKPYSFRTCGVQRLPIKAWEKHPVNAYGGSTTARHGRKATWDANRQERMIRADFISAKGRSCWAKSCKADQKEVEAMETACCTTDPCVTANKFARPWKWERGPRLLRQRVMLAGWDKLWRLS